MSAAIKICGVTKPQDIETLNKLAVELVGFNFYKPSPRHLSMERAAQLAAQCRPEMDRVALLVDPSDDDIDHALGMVSPHRLQLHGAESPERVADIKRRSHCAIIKALPIAEAADFETAKAYQDCADWFLFDAKPPQDGMPGGNGEAFDWTVLKAYDLRQPYLLAGGLTAENVADALTISGAGMVDIASGVETAPGEKDAAMMTDFVTAVRGV